MTLLEHVVATSTRKRPSTRTVYQAAIRAFIAFTGASPASWTGAAVER